MKREILPSVPVLTIIPFSYFLRQHMIRKFGKVAEEKMESFVSTLARRDDDGAQVLGVDDHLKKPHPDIDPISLRIDVITYDLHQQVLQPFP
jgi:hypothetical protein